MVNEKRLIDAKAGRKVFSAIAQPAEYKGVIRMVVPISEIDKLPTVDAVEVVHGHWKEYSHSALVRWKDGEPVWADRSVFRCSRCDFGTIAKHNYCPRCGAKMDREWREGE